jgi:hypothetical protein
MPRTASADDGTRMTGRPEIQSVTNQRLAIAATLLARFFAEEGFVTPSVQIARNLGTMLSDSMCWSALAVLTGTPVGIVTVTTMRYVE